MRKAISCLALSLIPLFAACTPEPESDLDAFATEPPEVTGTPSAADDEGTTDGEKEDAMTEPTIEIPEGDPPTELVVEDLTTGEGAEVKPGATVTIKYTGVSWSTGETFDSSWPGDATFPLDNLIQGWQEGIPGMKEGGRRRLTIPPDKAYGSNPPPGIAPNETLVFVIDLVKIG